MSPIADVPEKDSAGLPGGKRHQVANSVAYLLPVVLGNLVPLVTLPIFSRKLSSQDFGAWALAGAYAVVAAGIATVGLQTTYERNFFEYRDRGQGPHLLYSVIAFSVVSYLAVGVVTWWFRTPLTAWLIGDLGYANVLVWSFASSAVVGVKAYYLTYLKNIERARAFAFYALAERFGTAALQLLLIVWWGLGALGLVLGQLAASAVVLAVAGLRTLRPMPVAFAAAPLLDSLRLGLPLLPRVLLVSVGNNVDKLLLSQISSLGGVGIYSVGQRVANIGLTYLSALQNVFTPQVYSRMFKGGPDAARSIGEYLTPFAYVATALSFLIALFSEEILSVVAPPEYYGAIPVVSILVLYYAMLFFGKIPQIAFSKRMYLMPLLTVLSTGLNAGFGWAGISLFGTVGAAWGALTAGAIYTAVGAAVGQWCFRINWEARKLAAIFGLLFVSAFAAMALRSLAIPYAPLLAAKLCMVAAFAWLGWRLGILTAANVTMVTSMLTELRGRRPLASS